MSACPEPTSPIDGDALVREAEFKALGRLVKLTESESDRVALRACEVLLRYAREKRREEAQTTSASGGRKPPEGDSNHVRSARVDGARVDGAPHTALGLPSGGLRPPLAEVKKIPHALIHPPTPAPAFRAVPPTAAGATRGE